MQELRGVFYLKSLTYFFLVIISFFTPTVVRTVDNVKVNHHKGKGRLKNYFVC